MALPGRCSALPEELFTVWWTVRGQDQVRHSGRAHRRRSGRNRYSIPSVFSRAPGASAAPLALRLLGLATGVAIGIVESALKDRWLYVASGPLAGKQFILYKPLTTIGSSQSCDIYLFKDTSILPQHGSLRCAAHRRLSVLTGRYLFPARPRAIGHCKAVT